MSDKFKPEGFENIPTPERVSEEMRGATSQDGQSPGKDGGKVGQKAENFRSNAARYTLTTAWG